ncbi:biotin-dependent carboxyltransferase family protein [Motilibacter sp. E257]|uniref:Biotin-dependent carboxyltransferase family protein n=1 Tax=Motilibacter deserti TaxID=2714956 RepID=A0ABX0GQZ9_9ACTN|nr:biotin-dependent carboxyltransferase family protein [Motilibacter deserti]NHC12893.1 biotin-dependent carboxyltransferase family protein [Motilibacter deserti]
MIEVVHVAGLVTVQDSGRPGYGRWGVSPSGAADRSSHLLGARLVGNDGCAATLELTLGEVTLVAHERHIVAVTGAPAPITLDGAPMPSLRPLVLQPGHELRVGRATHGLRTYVSVAGGVDVPRILGSRSTDTLSGIGPPRPQVGDVLAVGAPTGRPVWDVDLPAEPHLGLAGSLAVRPGPRADWFEPQALRVLTGSDYEVTPDSNRVGARLHGPALVRRVSRELPPEGIVRGAVQVPAGGEPLVFLADHPVTGGYPVIGVLAPSDVDRLAQRRPGDVVRFRLVTGG